jgi:tetratricopeptide (TPR) repeat protein
VREAAASIRSALLAHSITWARPVDCRRHDEALRVLEQSLAQKEKGTAANDVGIARTLEDIGLVLQRMGKYDASGPLLRRALTIQETGNPKHPAYATTLNLIAQQFWFEGDIQASKRASEHAVQLAEETLRPDHPVVALSLRYLAATLFDLGESGRSRSLTERALAIAERNFGPNHHVTAEYLNDLGFTELDEGNYTAARRRLQQALEIYEARYGRFHEYVATTLSVSRVSTRMGDYATARQEQSRALDIYAKVRSNHPFVAVLTELATVYRDQGLPLQAQLPCSNGLAIREKNLGPGHRDVARTPATWRRRSRKPVARLGRRRWRNAHSASGNDSAYQTRLNTQPSCRSLRNWR